MAEAARGLARVASQDEDHLDSLWVSLVTEVPDILCLLVKVSRVKDFALVCCRVVKVSTNRGAGLPLPLSSCGVAAELGPGGVEQAEVLA